MAKIILRANLATNDFIVRQGVVNVELKKQTTPESVDVIISPLGSKIIEASNFYSGALPSSIKSISYSDSEKNVIATVAFNELRVDKETAVINLPITGVATVTQNKLILTETYPSDKTIVRQGGYGSSSVSYGQSTNSNTYEVVGKAGETVNVFERTFTAPSGYSFKTGPDYKINGKNYAVVSNEVKNDKGKITSKVFNIKYTFPSVSNNNDINNSIRFSYTLNEDKKQIVTEAKTKKEHKIYSIDTGREIGPSGGLKTITVTGVPGSPFKVLTSDTDNNVYNFKTGGFTAGGGMLEGVIPAALPGFSFGVFRAVVNVAPSATGNTVQTRVMTDKPVNHAKIAAAAKDDTIILDVDDETKIVDDVVAKTVTVNFRIKDGGVSDYIISKPIFTTDEVSADNLFETHGFIESIGPTEKNGFYSITGAANSEALFDAGKPKYAEIKYKMNQMTFYVMTNADDKFIRINRRPILATNREYIYTRWDGSVDLTDGPYKKTTTNGTILSDIGTSVRHTVTEDAIDGTTPEYSDFGVSFNGGVTPLKGDAIEHGVSGEGFVDEGLAYKGVAIVITFNGSLGDTDLDLDLNLNNFLTIFTA